MIWDGCMNDTIIRDCWKIILQKDPGLLDDSRLPLINIDNYLAYFSLPLLPQIEIKTGIVPDICSKEPSFKNLTDEILLWLRHHIYTQTELGVVAVWAEKLMRFCEVIYSTLKKRSVENWNDKTVAKLHLLHLSTFFLDYAVCTKDIRFLNIALKLADLKWIINRKMIKDSLSEEDKDIVSALFQFRIFLVIEYAINQISKGKII